MNQSSMCSKFLIINGSFETKAIAAIGLKAKPLIVIEQYIANSEYYILLGLITKRI